MTGFSSWSVSKELTANVAMCVQLQLEGLSCEACVASVEHTLDRLPGVLQTAVCLESSSAEVRRRAPRHIAQRAS